jgi:transcription initiation factor IIE alpha subunit
MLFQENKCRVLTILSENLKSPRPEVVDSSTIAEKLQLKIAETRQVIRMLHEKGAVVCDLDGEYSLITPQGLHWLQEKSFIRT